MSSRRPRSPGVAKTLTNDPVWTGLSLQMRQGFQETWYLKLNDLKGQRALWIRFHILLSRNGFRKVAETWCVLFQRMENREIQKTALKQSFDISRFSSQKIDGRTVIQIGDCVLGANFTKGMIQSKGKTIEWDFKFEPIQASKFELLPEYLAKMKMVRTAAATVGGDLRFDGTIQVDSAKISVENAVGMQAHLAGPKSAHSWAWGHCSSFVNEQKQPVPFVFEGLSIRGRIATYLKSPRLSTFYFLYQGKSYEFNRLWDTLRTRSENTLTDWEFQADRGDISFRGHVTAQLRDFVGMTYEDTDGSLLYCAASKLSDMTIWVYRRGKLETTLKSQGSTAFEVTSRTKNPYVPLAL
ncbi:MAG: hypothetical protein H7222_01780 [Methylotenera sp.]|nr:hypothetical protein [Oligoflexia bacterium]